MILLMLMCVEQMLSESLVSPSGELQLQISDVRSLRSDSVSGNIDSDVREPSSSMTMLTVTSGGEFQDKNKHMCTSGEEGEMNLSCRDENSSSHICRNEGIVYL